MKYVSIVILFFSTSVFSEGESENYPDWEYREAPWALNKSSGLLKRTIRKQQKLLLNSLSEDKNYGAVFEDYMFLFKKNTIDKIHVEKIFKESPINIYTDNPYTPKSIHRMCEYVEDNIRIRLALDTSSIKRFYESKDIYTNGKISRKTKRKSWEQDKYLVAEYNFSKLYETHLNNSGRTCADILSPTDNYISYVDKTKKFEFEFKRVYRSFLENGTTSTKVLANIFDEIINDNYLANTKTDPRDVEVIRDSINACNISRSIKESSRVKYNDIKLFIIQERKVNNPIGRFYGKSSAMKWFLYSVFLNGKNVDCNRPWSDK